MSILRFLLLICTNFTRVGGLMALMLASASVAASASDTSRLPIEKSDLGQTQSITVLVLGDSISAGFGIAKEKGWVNLLNTRLQSVPTCQGNVCQIVNASVSGSTTEDGANRIAKLMSEYQPALLILELGGNDGLRGYSLASMKDNLLNIIRHSESHQAEVLMLGMEIPPNYGKRYTEKFRQTFATVAKETQIDWVPFLLNAVATEKQYMQDDGIHPNEKAQPILMETVWQALHPLLNNKTDAILKKPKEKSIKPAEH